MTVTLYELAGRNPDLRFSPYCWRTRFALAHKDIPCDGIAWRFSDKDMIAFSGQGLVPVLVDGSRVVHDSWAIAEYLDDAYPNRPPLFPSGRAHTRFINAWADSILIPGIARLIVSDLPAILDDRDQDYFRTSREARFGMKLAEATADRATRVLEFRRSLQPLRLLLRHQPWIGGDMPDYADYIAAGSLQWPRCTSHFALLEPSDPVAGWLAAVLGLFGGLGERAVTV